MNDSFGYILLGLGGVAAFVGAVVWVHGALRRRADRKNGRRKTDHIRL
jgi:hypothetical protein